MNLILLEANDFTSSSIVRLSDRRAEHIRSVLRASAGDELRVGLVNGEMGRGLLTEVSVGQIVLEVVLDTAPPEPLPLTLYLALPRPKFLSKVLQSVTSLGVKEIFLFNSYKVEKVYWHCDQLSPAAIRGACLLGLEQARDTILPRVHLKRLFKPFVEDELPALARHSRAFVAHPAAKFSCPRGIATATTPVSLAVGPEGGFIEYELEKLTMAGFECVHFSERILKVETAVTALIARLT
jgi:RsmE family RNA methyltransferase